MPSFSCSSPNASRAGFILPSLAAAMPALDRLHSLQPLQPLHNLLIALRILNNKFGLAIHRQHYGAPRILPRLPDALHRFKW